ncbi:hypothetical protein [Streptomyces phaeochromogenes]
MALVISVIAERPELWEQLRANSEQAPAAAVEAVWWRTATLADLRVLRVPGTVLGVRVEAGTHVYGVVHIAHRDEKAFEPPDE